MPFRTLFVFALCALFSSNHLYAAFGCVTVYDQQHPQLRKVKLPEFYRSPFRTAQFRFSNLPKNMVPNKNGDYCYALSDARFAYVQSFYYAASTLAKYNVLLDELHITRPSGIVLKLVKDSKMPASGVTDGKTIKLNYANNSVDVDVLQHEITHWIIFAAIGTARQSSNKVSSWIHEGSANLLVALQNGFLIANQNEDNLGDGINEFVRFPDRIPTVKASMQKMAQAENFSKKYPHYVQVIRKRLQQTNKRMQTFLNNPDPYYVSAAINQPLWQLAQQYGYKSIQSLYLKSLAKLKSENSYPQFAAVIVRVAQSQNKQMADFLRKAYRERGLL